MTGFKCQRGHSHWALVHYHVHDASRRDNFGPWLPSQFELRDRNVVLLSAAHFLANPLELGFTFISSALSLQGVASDIIFAYVTRTRLPTLSVHYLRALSSFSEGPKFLRNSVLTYAILRQPAISASSMLTGTS